ncbi:MAG: hypothetical protein IJW23_11765 [Lentisphaeria bacterium]|nr:hypothetical protein [Lentisphaeria bacterium]
MIQKMKKITLLTLESYKQEMLDQLSELSVMHITVDRKKAGQGDAAQYIQKLDQIAKAQFLLEEFKKTDIPQKELPARECLAELLNCIAEAESLKKQLDELLKQKEKLAPWGDFDPASFQAVKKKGLFLKFWIIQAKAALTPPEGMVLQTIRTEAGNRYIMSIDREDSELPTAQEIKLPDVRYSDILKEIGKVEASLQQNREKAAALVCNKEALQEYAEEVRCKLDFANANLSMQSEQEIALLEGYIPVIRMDDFIAAVRKNGWAYLAEDPDPEDQNVPTYITKPKFLGLMDPLFDLVGIDPGYRENDVNAFFFIFFPIFFGMIIGDAGYGILFLLIALLCKKLFKGKKKAQVSINLFLMLSMFSLTWGWLNGNWFGISREYLPSFMRGIDFLANPQNSPLAQKLVVKTGLLKDGMTESQIAGMWGDLNNRIVQWFCFFLAAVHLSSARIFKFIVDIKEDWRAVGNLGWVCLLVANFFTAVNLIVFPGTFPTTFGYGAYIVGTLLLIITCKPQDFLNLPFSLIGSFTDVLSYIRLFAVGLAGTCIAVNFNNMGAMLVDGKTGISYVLMLIAMIVIVLFGHALNIALSFLSVLAHGVRLNTLEFSGHMGMQWTGIRYKPFAKFKNNKENLKNNNKEISK